MKNWVRVGCLVMFLFYAAMSVLLLEVDGYKAMGNHILALLWLIIFRQERD